jgi:mono/diheme cytochrome c family protein
MSRSDGATALGMLALAMLILTGCDAMPGRPKPADRPILPSEVTAFAALYGQHCAGCHGADGNGGRNGGSVVDAAYLALVSDQALRTAVIAGRTDLGMPDWRDAIPDQPLAAPQIADVVAWLAAYRVPVVGRSGSSMQVQRPRP